MRKILFDGYTPMLVDHMRVSADRQTTDLQCAALLAAGIDVRHLFGDRVGLVRSLGFVRPSANW